MKTRSLTKAEVSLLVKHYHLPFKGLIVDSLFFTFLFAFFLFGLFSFLTWLFPRLSYYHTPITYFILSPLFICFILFRQKRQNQALIQNIKEQQFPIFIYNFDLICCIKTELSGSNWVDYVCKINASQTLIFNTDLLKQETLSPKVRLEIVYPNEDPFIINVINKSSFPAIEIEPTVFNVGFFEEFVTCDFQVVEAPFTDCYL